MRVYITGIAGFLGSHLADAFLDRGWEVYGCDSLLGGEASNVPAGASWSILECTDWVSLVEHTAEARPDVVYHCAAAPHEGLSVFSPALVTMHGPLATATVLSVAARCRVRRFVFTSSMSRYGRQAVPFREHMAPIPVDPYGVGKVAAEGLVRVVCEAHGLEWAIAVPHNIYGPRQRYWDPYRNVVGIMVNRMLQGKPPIIYGDGSQRRCFSYVTDVLDPLVRLATDDVAGEIFNVGPDRDFISVSDLSQMLRSLVGFDGLPEHVPARPCEVQDATCSADKARAILDYTPSVSLQAGLTQTVAWIKEQGPRPFIYHLPIEIENENTPQTWSRRLM